MLTRKVICFIIFLFCIHGITAQRYIWSKNFSNQSSGSNKGHDICFDKRSNIFLTGSYGGMVDFDPDTGSYFLSGTSNAYLSKHLPDGSHLWTIGVGGLGFADGLGCETDGQGNVAFYGRFHDTVDFDPGAGVKELIGHFDSSLFVAKYDSLGNLKSVVELKSNFFCLNPATQHGLDRFKMDEKGSMYLGGSFKGSSDFDPDPTKQLIYKADGEFDGYVVKYAPDHKLRWAIHLRSITRSPYTNGCGITSINIGELGDVYVCGAFGDSVDFDPSSSDFIRDATYGGQFLAKYDSSGNFLWVRTYAGPSPGLSPLFSIPSIALDGNDNVYLVGHFTYTCDFDPGPGTYYLSAGNWGAYMACYDKSGNFKWVRKVAELAFPSISRISLAGNGQFYITGLYSQISFFGSKGFITLPVQSNSVEIFLAQIDSGGYCNWALNFGGLNNDYGDGMITDNAGNVLICGEFMGDSVDFNPGAGHAYHGNSLSPSTYFAKYGPCNASPNVVVYDTICQGEKYIFPDGTSSMISKTDTSLIKRQYGCDSTVIVHLRVEKFTKEVIGNGPLLTAKQDSATYQWLRCDSTGYSMIPGANGKSYTAPKSGEYAVIIRKGGCTDTSACIQYLQSGIDLFTAIDNVKIYPNPTDGLITIDFGKISGGIIRVYNSTGALILEEEKPELPKQLIDLKAISGLYFIELITAQGNRSFKIAVN